MNKALNKKEFEVLKYIRTCPGDITQRLLADATGVSLGTANKILKELVNGNYIDKEYSITQYGVEQIEKFRVKNAIILAAGMSTGSNQLVRDLPKGLYVAKGEVLIERIIRQLREKEIENIYVVVGYRMDQFFYLEDKYGVKIIVNPSYVSQHSSASLSCAQNVLGNSYIIPNDEYFAENIFNKYEYETYYATIYSEERTTDTFLDIADNGRIIGVHKGDDLGWIMIGHSYMSAEYANEYIQWLEAFEKSHLGGKLYWEEVFYSHLKEVPIYAHRYEAGIIREFDELSELSKFDNYFVSNIDDRIFSTICELFNANKEEITDIVYLQDGSVDVRFMFKVRNDAFIFRYPSRESKQIFNYEDEMALYDIVSEGGMDDSFVYENECGFRISRVTEDIEDIDPLQYAQVIKEVKNAGVTTSIRFDFRERIRNLYLKFDNNQKNRMRAFEKDRKMVEQMLDYIEADGWKKELCHNNISSETLKKLDGRCCLTEWDMAGITDSGFDIALLASLFSQTQELNLDIVEIFVKADKKNLRHLHACLSVYHYYRFLLGIYYSNDENSITSALYDNWKKAVFYAEKVRATDIDGSNIKITQELIVLVEHTVNGRVVETVPIAGGVTNLTYKVTIDSGNTLVLRIPGEGTNEYINRKDEIKNINEANSLGIIPSIYYSNGETGIIISQFVNNSSPCTNSDIADEDSLREMCKLLYRIHSSDKVFDNEFDLVKMQKQYREVLREMGAQLPKQLQIVEAKLDTWMKYLQEKCSKNLVACHIDPKLNNFLKANKKLYLIDWEYSGMADQYFELANFTLTNNLTPDEENRFINMYFEVSNSEFDEVKYLLYKFATDYLWLYWHLIKVNQGSLVEYNEMSWRKRLSRAKNIVNELEKML